MDRNPFDIPAKPTYTPPMHAFRANLFLCLSFALCVAIVGTACTDPFVPGGPCTDDTDCGGTRLCIDNRCTIPNTGDDDGPGPQCTTAQCLAVGKVCDLSSGTCRDCNTGECGTKVCVSGVCEDCGPSVACTTGECIGGACVEVGGSPCTSNSECGDLVCTLNGASKTCNECLPGECNLGRTCVSGRCQTNISECSFDGDCNPPSMICNAGQCIGGCTMGSCAAGFTCNLSTGRCDSNNAGALPLSADCIDHEECQTGICWALIDTGTFSPIGLCGTACTRDDDCPPSSGCLELGDSNVCVTLNRLGIPAGFVDDPPGTTCDMVYEDLDCTTGYCASFDGVAPTTCSQMCGADNECTDVDPSAICTRQPIDKDSNGSPDLITQLCRAPIGVQAAGTDCGSGVGTVVDSDHAKCESNWCALTANQTIVPQCAQTCCTDSDCGDAGRPICKPVHQPDGIYLGDPNAQLLAFTKMCYPREHAGLKALGETCADNTECDSEICASGPSGIARCTTTCCDAADCNGFGWSQGCRTPFPPGSHIPDSNFIDIVSAMGRTIQGPTTGIAVGFGSLCMPN